MFVLGSGPLDESPGPQLTIHGSSPELQSVIAWMEDPPPIPNLPPRDMEATVRFDERNELLWKVSGVPSPARVKQILRSLLLGATLIDHSDPEQRAASISREIYERVCRVLASSRTHSDDESSNPLAFFMTQRANAYLFMKREQLQKTDGNETYEWIHLHSEGLITRREVVDLGNTNGPTTLKVVKFLMTDDEKGLEKFCKCGLSVPIEIEKGEWPSRDAEVCRKLLLRWSPKQVRTHFHRLVSEGLISAIRTSDNQPWQYRLPESLAEAASPFRKLPTADALSFPLGSIERSAPDCPPTAQVNGQAEVVD